MDNYFRAPGLSIIAGLVTLLFCAMPVNKASAESLPDLAVVSLSVSNEHPAPGEEITVSIGISNLGSTTSDATELRVSHTGENNVPLSDTADVKSLGPGVTTMVLIQIIYGPNDLGWHHFSPRVDYLEQVDELNESNNSRDPETAYVEYPPTTATMYTTIPWTTFGWWPGASNSWTKVAGFVLNDQGDPYYGGLVYIQFKRADGSWGWKANAHSRSDGYFQRWFQPFRTADYRVAVARNYDDSVPRVFSEQSRINVRYRADLGATPWDIRLGGWTKISGWVRPWHTSGTVYVQWYDYGQKEWRYLGTTSIGDDSTFTYWYEPAWRWSDGRPWQFRAKVVGHWDHATNFTPVRKVWVH